MKNMNRQHTLCIFTASLWLAYAPVLKGQRCTLVNLSEHLYNVQTDHSAG